MCPLGSLHYNFLCTQCKGPRKGPRVAWFLAWMWVVDMLLRLNGHFSDQLIHLWDTTIPYCSIYHAYVTFIVCTCHYSDKSKSQSQSKAITLCLSLIVHPHPAVAHCLPFVSMAWTSRLPEKFQGSSEAQVHLTIIIIIYHHDYE